MSNNLITDAAYDIMLNNKLRAKFLEKYNLFPAIYEKHTKALKSSINKRIYSTHYDDCVKIACVLYEAIRDKKLLEEIESMVFKHFLNLSLPYINTSYGEVGLYFSSTVNTIRTFLEDTIYYEYQYLFAYMKKYFALKRPTAEEKTVETFVFDMVLAALTKSNTVSFKEYSSKINKYIRTNSAKTPMVNNWDNVFELAKDFFGVNKKKISVDYWGGYFGLAENIDLAEAMYGVILGKKEFNERARTGLKVEENEPEPKKFTYPMAFAYEILICLSKYIRLGIDAPMILLRESLDDKEIRDIVYMTKKNREFFGLKTESREDWCLCIHEITQNCISELIVKDYKNSLKAEKAVDNTTISNNVVNSTLLSLKNENRILTGKVSEHEKEIDQLTRKYNAQIKELNTQIYELSKTTKKEEPAAAKEAPINNEEATTSVEQTNDINDDKINQEVTEETFKEFINNYNILVWGFRDSQRKKIKEKYPQLGVSKSDRTLTHQQIRLYDGVIMCTNFTSHSSYFNARDVAKAASIPIAVLDNGHNNDYWLWKAGEELKQKIS